MRDGGRIAAAIDVLTDVLNRHQPVKSAARDWGKRARYAGSKDRAFVSGLVLDALRKKNSIAHAMGSDEPRALILGALAHAWGWDIMKIDSAMDEDHAPSKLTLDERERLVMAPDVMAEPWVSGDYPEWMEPMMDRVFGEEKVIEAQAMAVRADVDIRVNTLKVDAEKAGGPMRSADAQTSTLLKNAFHIPARDPSQRETSLESIPAYSKGWVEVQDAGSQIAAAAANAKPGEQVLDYCAGGGGKTLAIAAMMEGKGQIHAYDIDGRRLSALIPRLKRSGAHNVQLVHPREPEALEALKGQMDVVFVDAPCTGTGTWRRRPDAKWRLKAKQLEKRTEEQTEILEAASAFVKPGGKLVYATCSFLIEEDEDRVADFLSRHDGFEQLNAAEEAVASELLTDEGAATVKAGCKAGTSVRLTPRSAGTDGFFFAVMRRL
ncbi:RsmB/NOP family class I SAM-dependent RNA methyltransferase [Henriciella sp. AS95]|uniref:RsmB/NOP family class I SAM-dependent RNA methyltransferase n=1 Tax=Henriciella sp. AS95 TaxID=3135782 RepID=UPI003171B183